MMTQSAEQISGINVIYRRFKTWRRTFEHYFHCQQSVEVETPTRRERIEEYGDYAEVNSDSIVKPRMLVGPINKHKRSEITDEAYFNKLVRLVTECDSDLR